MTSYTRAYIFAVVTVLLWSTVASAFKITLKYLDPTQMLLWASMVSVLVLLAIIVKEGKFRVLFSYSRMQYFQSVGLGFLNPAVYYLVLFDAYSLLPAQEAQPLNMIWPLVLVLLSVPILGQKVGITTFVGILFSFFGIVVISTHGDILGFQFTSIRGTSMAIASSFIWSLYWIYNIKDKRDEVVKLCLNFAAGLVFIAVFVLLSSGFELVDIRGMFGATYIGIFEMGITFVLWLKALSLSKQTSQVSKLIFLVPFLSLVFIGTVLREEILPSTMLGLVFIVGGIMLGELEDRYLKNRLGISD